MQVGACAPACVATESYNLSGPYFLILVNELLREMSIDGLQSVGMPDNDVLAVACGLVSDDAYFSRECCPDGIADVYLDVKSLVLSSASGSEIACHHPALCWHAEVLEVDAEGVGHGNGLVGVCVVPVLVELGGR